MPDAMLASVDAALDGHCSVDTRALLAAEVVGPNGERKRGLALNDVVVTKKLQSGQIARLRNLDRRSFREDPRGRRLDRRDGHRLHRLRTVGRVSPIVAPDLDVVVVRTDLPTATLSDRPIVVSPRAPRSRCV
jgi:NAD kinase